MISPFCFGVSLHAIKTLDVRTNSIKQSVSLMLYCIFDKLYPLSTVAYSG